MTGLTTIVHRKADQIGSTQTKVSFLVLYHFDGGTFPMPGIDKPYLYFVVDGSMRLYTPFGIMDYIAGQYSVSAIDTPESGKILTVSPGGGFYSLSVAFSLDDVLSVMLQLDEERTAQIAGGNVDETVKEDADRQVVGSIYNLLCLLDRPSGGEFVANSIRREIIYYVLCGSCGQQFLQSMIGFQAGEIYEVNSWIKRNFRDSFTIEELAQRQNISVSLLRQKFKSAVGMGVLQCQKRLRLTEARRLMLDEGKNVTEAAMGVGYESVSQFTREYGRMYGKAPKEDIQSLKEQLWK